LLQLLISTLTL